MTTKKKKTENREIPPIYSTAFWLYRSADFLYLEALGITFAGLKKLLEDQKFKDEASLFLFSAELLNKFKNIDKHSEIKTLIEKYRHLPHSYPSWKKAIDDILRLIPNDAETVYGDIKEIVVSMLRNHIHPVLILSVIKELEEKQKPLTDIDGFLLLKKEFPYMRIPKTLAIEYILRKQEEG